MVRVHAPDPFIHDDDRCIKNRSAQSQQDAPKVIRGGTLRVSVAGDPGDQNHAEDRDRRAERLFPGQLFMKEHRGQ